MYPVVLAKPKKQTNKQTNKQKVDKLDNHKLKPLPIDLKKLSNLVDKDVVKKTVYHELVKVDLILVD